MVSQKHRAGNQSSEFRVLSVADCSREEFMEIQKPTSSEIKRVKHVLEFEDEEELTDREIWIAREFLDE